MYYKSHIITTKTTERESVMITQRRKKDQKTTLATVLQTVLEAQMLWLNQNLRI